MEEVSREDVGDGGNWGDTGECEEGADGGLGGMMGSILIFGSTGRDESNGTNGSDGGDELFPRRMSPKDDDLGGLEGIEGEEGIDEGWGFSLVRISPKELLGEEFSPSFTKVSAGKLANGGFWGLCGGSGLILAKSGGEEVAGLWEGLSDGLDCT